MNNWWVLLKKQERTFIITDVDWDMKVEDDAEDDIKTLLWMVDSITARELDIDKDYDKEDIEDEISSWISITTGWLHSGFTWYEITENGEKKDW